METGKHMPCVRPAQDLWPQSEDDAGGDVAPSAQLGGAVAKVAVVATRFDIGRGGVYALCESCMAAGL